MQIVASSSPYGFSPIGNNNNNNGNMASPLVISRGRVSPVRRRLFADDDDQTSSTLDNRTLVLQQQLESMQLDQQRRWNFDFNNQSPLDGRYRWYQQPIERPSHPPPPQVGTKRPRHQQQQVIVSSSKMAKFDWCNNNNSRQLPANCNQTKITGTQFLPFFGANFRTFFFLKRRHKMVGVCRGGKSLLLLLPFCVCLPPPICV